MSTELGDRQEQVRFSLAVECKSQMKNYFADIDDQLGMLENRIGIEVDLDKDPQGHVKMSVVRDAFSTMRNAMKIVNTVMDLDVV